MDYNGIMSKTDKTAPWWTQVTEWEPFHFCVMRHIPCDLPPAPPTNANEARKRTHCAWTPVNWQDISKAFPKIREDWDPRRHPSRTRAKQSWKREFLSDPDGTL